jgi:mono/diheme cytochrome c family protein
MWNSVVRWVTSGAPVAVVAWCLHPVALHAGGGQAPKPAVSPDSVAPPAQVQPIVTKYCVSCHNDRAKTGGLSLQNVDAAHPEANAELWERVLRKLRSEAMPPVGLPRPDKATYQAVAAALETALDRAAAGSPNPGGPSIHRLNRTEYTNAIRDLIALEIDGRTMLPPDDQAYGFDNIADNLSVNPGLMDRYLVAARKIGRLAFGYPESDPPEQVYKIPKFYMQDERAEDQPFGTRGGLAVRHYFPLDGEYTFTVKLERNHSEVLRGLTDKSQLEIRIDRERVKLFTVGGLGKRPPCYVTNTCPQTPDNVNQADDGLEVRLPLKAGTHLIGVSFIDEQRAKPEGPLPFRATVWQFDSQDIGSAMVFTVAVNGPFNGQIPVDTPSRRAIFVCQPTSSRDEAACAEKIISRLARRAFRRPVSNTDVDVLMRSYREGRANATFDRAIERSLRTILVDPEFLFRIERQPAGVAPDTAYKLSDLDLASRLSFFLWSSIPDDELLDIAARGKLSDPAVLNQQVARMLRDPRSKALADNFGGQWLLTRNVRLSTPNPDIFIAWDENLREAFQKETELFFENMLRDDRSVRELLTANYTFLNEQLARHYGVAGVYGGHFRRVTLPADSPRGGILGHGSVLLVTSYADRTSPVLRGKWLLENLLGTPPPDPPAGVPPLEESGPLGPTATMRQRMEKHRSNPQCSACHARMDPLGFAMENFDAIGAWRTAEGNQPIDASGQLLDGTKIAGPGDLKRILLSREHEFVGTVIEKLMTYALGRGTEYYDAPTVRQILRTTAPDNYRWSSIISAIVRSTPFQMRRAPAALPQNTSMAQQQP